MTPTPIIDMFSGTGELARAVSAGLEEPTRPVSFSDNYGPARKYLKYHFPGVEVCKDLRDQDVPEGSIVTIGAPSQDLSVAGKRAGAERGSGTRSSLIHEALDMAVTGSADLIVAESVPGGHRTYLDLARWLETEHNYRTAVPSGGAWEVGAPHRRERIMLVAARRCFEPRCIEVIRQVAPLGLLPTPTASSATGPGRSGRCGGANLQTRIHEGPDPDPALIITWARTIGEMHSPLKDDEGRLNADFVEWLMGLPSAHAVGLSRTASIRLAGNAVVRLQGRLMLQRGLTAINHERTL
nr:MAG TPA: Cytosine specific methyltransferase [Caudoviricetes sp.]